MAVIGRSSLPVFCNTNPEPARPLTVPPTLNVSKLKLAVTLSDCSRVPEQVMLVPAVQAPPQPVKVEPLVAMAVRLTMVPAAKLALQVLPQLIPEGLLVTVPLPEPDLETKRV